MLDDIIGASLVAGRDDIVYCLGPFARRVSFSAQQTRALNLVWALGQRGKLSTSKRTAVIGAGVAGLTAAAGLIGHGCSVDVFEGKSEPMARQLHTEHRLVHPTVNQWPEHELSLTTELPFLEWSAGLCSTVTKSIGKQFEDLRGSNRLLRETEVVDLSDQAAGLVQVRTKKRLGNPRFYHLVIIAIGFGEERSVPGLPITDYWWPDALENMVASGKIEDFLVSGCGDGGLIDALRVVHHKFAKGQLAYDLAAELSGTSLATAIAAAELAARANHDPTRLTLAYEEAAAALITDPTFETSAKRLELSLDRGQVVYLLDQALAAPFSLNAAPIHKLMVAHARRLGKITYRQAAAALHGTEIRFAGLRIPAPPKSHVIVRHGPEYDFGRLLSSDEVSDLAQRQARLADKQADPIWTEPYPVPPPMRPRDLTDPHFIASRAFLAQRAINALSEGAEIMPLTDRLRAIYKGALPVGAPNKLFGIPVESEIRSVVPGIG